MKKFIAEIGERLSLPTPKTFLKIFWAVIGIVAGLDTAIIGLLQLPDGLLPAWGVEVLKDLLMLASLSGMLVAISVRLPVDWNRTNALALKNFSAPEAVKQTQARMRYFTSKKEDPAVPDEE